jgi:hypothetical protein
MIDIKKNTTMIDAIEIMHPTQCVRVCLDVQERGDGKKRGSDSSLPSAAAGTGRRIVVIEHVKHAIIIIIVRGASRAAAS